MWKETKREQKVEDVKKDINRGGKREELYVPNWNMT